MATTTTALPPLGLRYFARTMVLESRFEFLKMLRTRAFSLSVIGFPIMFYLMFGVSNRYQNFARYIMATYSCMGVVSACLFGIGMGIALERAQGWLQLKFASPMPRAAYIGAKILGSAAFAIIILAALIALGLTAGGVHLSAGEALRLGLVILLGTIPFTAMALLLAILLPANSASGIINLIYLPMSFLSGFWMPISILPHWLQVMAPALPTYHLAQLALNVVGDAGPGSMMAHWEALAGFTLVMLGAAWFVFARKEADA